MLDGIAAMKQENLDRLRHYGFDNRDILSDTRMDVRFAGQEFTVTVHLDKAWLLEPDTVLDGVCARFVTLHRAALRPRRARCAPRDRYPAGAICRTGSQVLLACVAGRGGG